MKEKDDIYKNEQEIKNVESQIVIQQDRQDLEQEKQKQKQRTKSLLRVTARNKEVKE
jgi:hypothetical protein